MGRKTHRVFPVGREIPPGILFNCNYIKKSLGRHNNHHRVCQIFKDVTGKVLLMAKPHREGICRAISHREAHRVGFHRVTETGVFLGAQYMIVI